MFLKQPTYKRDLITRTVLLKESQQGRIHGNPVVDGWAGAVMQKPLGIQKCDGPTDL